MLSVRDDTVHALLHASLLRQLPVQPLLSGFQLVLQWTFVVLIDFSCFLQDVNLEQNHMAHLRNLSNTKTSKYSITEAAWIFLLPTLCSCILVFFSKRSSSALLVWMILSFSNNFPFCSWMKLSLEMKLLSSSWSIDLIMLAKNTRQSVARGQVRNQIQMGWTVRAELKWGATCFVVLFNHHLPDPVSVLQSFNQPGQRDIIVRVGQLRGGQRWEAVHQLVYNRGHICRNREAILYFFL